MFARERKRTISTNIGGDTNEVEPLISTTPTGGSSIGNNNTISNTTNTSTLQQHSNTTSSSNASNTNSGPSSGNSPSLLHQRNISHTNSMRLPRRSSNSTFDTTSFIPYIMSYFTTTNSIKFLVLIILSLQNSLFTVLRRYSQGIRQEMYSKYEVLMVGEIIKLLFSSYMIHTTLLSNSSTSNSNNIDSSMDEKNINTTSSLSTRLLYLTYHSRKMIGLALIYGIMNVLSFVALRNIGAGLFTIIAQCKILTTALFSSIILHRIYSYTKWRALIALVFGVLLFSEPIWNTTNSNSNELYNFHNPMVMIGILSVVIEVTLSGFASIYFEKVIKLDPLPFTIWERNFQLALGSIPVYICFILWDGGGTVGFFGGWSILAWVVTILGAAGGLLVALSIKYGDAILKTLATTAAIILSSVLDYTFLNGPLTPIMIIAAAQVILAICNYTFDTTPETPTGSIVVKENNINASNNSSVSNASSSSSNDVELAMTTMTNNDDNAKVSGSTHPHIK